MGIGCYKKGQDKKQVNERDSKNCKAERQTRVSLLPGFSTSRETENFQKTSWKSREIFEFPKIFEIPGIREIFGKFPEVDCFAFSGFQHFRSHFSHFVMLF